MKKKRVLIIEDEQLQRETLHQGLEWRGFEVASAAGAAEAREVVAAQTEPFDVVVLDMQLKDSYVTGADLGIEFRRQHWQTWPPEFLVNSAHTKSDYLKLALELGAAAYLEKGGSNTVIHHVRALAVRHGLSVERDGAMDDIQALATDSRSQGEAVLRFCKDILSKELKQCLGAPFVLLATIDGRTYGWSASELPRGARPEYDVIQALTHGTSTAEGLFVLDEGWGESLAHELRADLLPALKGSVSIPLYGDNRLRLSLCILPSTTSLDQDALGLGRTLVKYLAPAVLKQIMVLQATQAEMSARQLAMVSATSQLCLYIGQEQLLTIEAAEDAGEVLERAAYVRKIQALSEDLCRAGELLGELAESQERSAVRREGGPQKRSVSMRATVERAWQKVSRMVRREGPDVLDLVPGDCVVVGRPDYLEIAASRVLLWLAQRLAETPEGVEPGIVVRFVDSPDGEQIIFEDRSRRLAHPLRALLFSPASQVAYQPTSGDLASPGMHFSLYVARMLVELGNGGRLEDRSEELGGKPGHRIVMNFQEAEIAWT